MAVNPRNSTNLPLGISETFTGEWQDAGDYPTLVITAKTDQDGTLYVDFSPDGTNVDRSLTFTVVAGVSELHRLAVVNLYFRVRFINSGGGAQTYLRLQTLLSTATILATPLNISLQDDADAVPVKAILHGQTDSGQFFKVPVDSNGHLEVALHSPRLPFGSIHTESLDPVFQHDAVYGINANNMVATTNASGTATADNSAFVCTTGTTIYGAGSLQSRDRLIYRPGQGSVGRFTALFTTGVANSYQVAGYGHAEDGIYFGYKGTQFGIIYNSRGKREVRTLTISTKSSHAENAVVTLNGTAYNVAVTNGASTVTTAYEISQGTFTGWKAESVGSTVVFVSDSVGAKSGAYSISGTSVIGSVAQSSAGQAVTESFIAQSAWNGDKMDGTGASGVTIDPTKFNVYQMQVQYLGAGALTFQVEAAHEGNNPDWVTVHSILLPNTLTQTSFGNPSFPFTMSAYSAGSTTNLTVKCGSVMGANEGSRRVHGDRLSYTNTLTSVGSTNYQCIFSIRNTRYHASRTNQSVIKILSIAAALKHTSPCTIYIFKNATLAGSPNFAQYSTNSVGYYDTAATTCTIANNNQLIWSGSLGDTGNLDFQFTEDIRIQPGETITVAAKSATGSPSYVIGSLNTKEFQ